MDHNAVRLALAQRMADLHAQRFALRGSILVGSAAQGLADASSDIDMTLYYEVMPPQDALLAVREEIGGSPQVLLIGSCAEGGLVESYWLEGIRIDFAHSTLARLQRDLDTVLVDAQPDSPYQKICSGLQHGVPLVNAKLAAELRQRVSAYPHSLRMRMVETYLRFHPRWVLERMGHVRGDEFLLREKLVEAARGILLSLCGVNRVYHWGEFKHLAWIAEQFAHRPANLAGRVTAMLTAAPESALAELYALILETYLIVEHELPELDVAERRTKYLREYGC
jgi:hypothetical protein